MENALRWLLRALAGCALAQGSALAATFYVWQFSPSAAPPYGDWVTAAHAIQDAVDLGSAGDEVLVLNGVYASGGRAVDGLMTNRVAIDKSMAVVSVNGAAVTTIVGAGAAGGGPGEGAVRCVYLADGAILSGFTLSNGATRTVYDPPVYAQSSGGGVWCQSTNAVVQDCVLVANVAAFFGGGAAQGTLDTCAFVNNSAAYGGAAAGSTLNDCTLTGNAATFLGGGAYLGMLNGCLLTGNSAANGGGGASQSTLNNCTLTANSSLAEGGGAAGGLLNNCTLTGNSASYYGGGMSGSTLNECTVTGNSATYFGGGAYYGTLNNCIVYLNTAADGPNYTSSDMNFYCTLPPPGAGLGNIAKDPAFVNAAAGDFHLRSNSPCINSGDNSYVSTVADLDGNPRMVSGTVDVGAYEYQGAGSVISYAWLQQYHLPVDGSVDSVDLDHDGMTTQQEWVADTNPTNAASVLRLTLRTNGLPVTVSFSSSANRVYSLLSCSNLTCTPPGPAWNPVPGQINVPGAGGVLLLTDTNPPTPAFYRVSVCMP